MSKQRTGVKHPTTQVTTNGMRCAKETTDHTSLIQVYEIQGPFVKVVEIESYIFVSLIIFHSSGLY